MIIECSHCESKVDGKEKGEVHLDQEFTGVPTKIVLIECPACGSALLGVSELYQCGLEEWEWDNADRCWPPSDDSVDFEIPQIARLSLLEAKLCFKARAYSACAVMCGRSLEGLCKDHDARVRNLATGLKIMKESGAIDSRLFNWGEALRKHRNLGAHASTEKVSKEDARDLLDFCIAICEYIYVLSAKFDKFQERQSAKKT